MLISINGYGKAPDPVILLARGAASPAPAGAAAQKSKDQLDRLFVQQSAMWLFDSELRPKGPQPGPALEPVFGGSLQDLFRDKGLESYPNWAEGNQVLGMAVTTYGCYWKWFGSEKVSPISRFFCLFKGIFVLADLLSNHPSLQSMKPAWDQVKAWLTVIVVVYETGEEVRGMVGEKGKKPQEIIVRASDPRARQLVAGLRSYRFPLRPVNPPIPPPWASKDPSGRTK